MIRVRSRSMASQVFGYFCANAAIVNGLFFDLATTHLGTALWTFSIAQLGGAVIALAVVLPDGIATSERQFKVRLVSYGISSLLVVWGWIELINEANPWGYIAPWRASYIFMGLAFFIFIGVQANRLRLALNPLARQQVRMVLWGAVMSFTPIGLWLIAQLVWSVPFNPVIFLPLLLLFPVAISIAIIRYRMWEIDLIIRRTVIYTMLTALLLVIYFFLILFFDYVFTRLLGRSILSSVFSTFIIVLIFTPLRRWIQRWVDHRFYRYHYRPEVIQGKFQDAVRMQVDPQEIGEEFIQIVDETLQPEFMAFWLQRVPDQRQLTKGDKNV